MRDVFLIGGGRDPRALAPCAGVDVAGGHTPSYLDRCVPGDWLPADVPYAGFSAGAPIAAEQAAEITTYLP